VKFNYSKKVSNITDTLSRIYPNKKLTYRLYVNINFIVITIHLY